MSTTTLFPENVMASSPVGVGSLSAVELDGFLTAIAIGPDMVMPSEWLEALWDSAPAFKAIEDVQAMMNTLMLHYNSILRQLEAPETYRPCGFPDDPTALEIVSWATEWVQGFDRATKLRPKEWLSMLRNESCRDILSPIMLFVKHEGKPTIKDPSEELVAIMAETAPLIPEVIPEIRDYWREAHEQPRQHRSRRPGRNEPCPCGSQKKYKRCCGSN
jgi:uncharacterized protein